MSAGVTTRRLGRPPRSENQRELILGEAARLFATVGYENCTIAELAAAMNISKAAIYHYFPKKSQIYEEIIVSTLDRLRQYVDAAIDRQQSAAEQLRVFMTAHARFFEIHYWAFTAMLAASGGIAEAARSPAVVDIRDRHEARARRIIEDGLRAGEFRATDAATAARAILSMLNWMVRWFRPGGPKSAERIADEYYRLIFEGIKKRE